MTRHQRVYLIKKYIINNKTLAQLRIKSQTATLSLSRFRFFLSFQAVKWRFSKSVCSVGRQQFLKSSLLLSVRWIGSSLTPLLTLPRPCTPPTTACKQSVSESTYSPWRLFERFTAILLMNSTYGLPLVTEQKRGLVCHYRPRGRSALQLVGVDLVQPSINRANKGGDAICWTRVETTTLEETAKCLYVQRVGCPV